MTHDELAYLSAAESGELIAKGELSPIELTSSLLERIEERDSELNSFLTVTADIALSAARSAEKRALAHERIGPLDGVPHSLKDHEATKGIRTTDGAMWNRDRVPTHNSIVSERMLATGSPLLGKTNVPNGGYKEITENFLGPAARNPWDVSRTPGGSSGGAAAAVAAGFGALAQGGDGAGSIRIPASFSGVVGFKPSAGRVPIWPTSEWGVSVSIKGPLTRTVIDSALMAEAMAGFDERDPFSIDATVPDLVAATRRPIAGLRVAYSPDMGWAKVNPEVAAVCAKAVLAFEDLGCTVSEERITWGTLARDTMRPVWHIGFAAAFAEHAVEFPQWIEPSLQAIIDDARRFSALDYQRALGDRTRLYHEVRGLFTDFDLLITPTMPDVAYPAEGEPDISLFDRLPFTYPFNLTGHPAITVPCGFDHLGRPIGLQIVADFHRDDIAVTAASRFEEAHPWPIRPPG